MWGKVVKKGKFVFFEFSQGFTKVLKLCLLKYSFQTKDTSLSSTKVKAILLNNLLKSKNLIFFCSNGFCHSFLLPIFNCIEHSSCFNFCNFFCNLVLHIFLLLQKSNFNKEVELLRAANKGQQVTWWFLTSTKMFIIIDY